MFLPRGEVLKGLCVLSRGASSCVINTSVSKRTPSRVAAVVSIAEIEEELEADRGGERGKD